MMKMNRLLNALCFVLIVYSQAVYAAPLGSWVAYVGNQISDNVTPIQLATGTGTPLTSIPLLTLTPNTAPQAIAITPDGNTAYVVENDENEGNGNVVVINTLTNTVTTVIHFPDASFPSSVAIAPNGLTAYVVDSNSGQVIPIDTTTNMTGTVIQLPLNSGPVDLAITPDGLMAYVVGDNLVFPINLMTDTVGTPITVGDSPNSIAITPNGQKAYVTNLVDNTVTVINLNTQTTKTITGIALLPFDVAINPAGTRAYVLSNNLFSTGQGNLTVIDTTSDTIIGTPVLEGVATSPNMLAIAPDGLTAYVVDSGEMTSEGIMLIPNAGTTVTPIDISTDIPVVLTPISIAAVGGMGPDSIAITPDQAPTASFSANAVTLGLPTVFDASSSSSPVGIIAQYAWNFGDNNSIVTTSPTVSHTYAASGNYLVILTVTNSAGTSTTQIFTGHTVSNNGGASATLSQSVSVTPIIPPPLLLLLPPTHLKGIQKANEFATQTDYINILTWKAPSEGESPVAYRIYKDSSLTQLVATIAANDQLRFKDHNRKKNHTYMYFIVSVDAMGNQSPAATVTVHPRK